jgi:hypothetical protein
MTPEEREALKTKHDEYDEVDFKMIEKDDSTFLGEYDFREFMDRHGINLAKAFLGKDDGLTFRKIKKIYLKEKRYEEL